MVVVMIVALDVVAAVVADVAVVVLGAFDCRRGACAFGCKRPHRSVRTSNA